MSRSRSLLRNYLHIQNAARSSEDGQRCMVAPHPDLRERINKELESIRARGDGAIRSLARASEPRRPGFNDGLIIPPDAFPLGTPMSTIRNVAAERAPLRGTLRVIVVLVDFSDKHMTQTQQHYRDLFFSTGVIPTRSVREYYTEVTHGLINIQGDVVGPFRLPQTIAQYAHAASGIGNATPNAQTMARDAATAADGQVNFDPFDNDGNGFVDAFIVIHAGSGGEVTGNPNDIWSHKWTLQGGAKNVDHTKIFAYLTVPEDALVGVCCHELGHLLFGFPDLYDTDGSSEGIGNWCLMAGGSWGGGGNTPCHPSAWCKANQGWAAVDNRTANGNLTIADVKDSNTVYRLWKDGAAGNEYFLVENRQKKNFDSSLPAGGLLIWHIDESISGNTDESHYKVALMQADAKRDMEHNVNRGDAGDCYPGSANNGTFNKTSNPNSLSYGGVDTCVAVTSISASGPSMSASVQVKCKAKEVLKDLKDSRKDVAKDKDKEAQKDVIDKRPQTDKLAVTEKLAATEKLAVTEKTVEKPITDKTVALDKNPISEKVTDGKFADGKFSEGKLGEIGGAGGQGASEARLAYLESRVAALEAALGQSGSAAQPFIGSTLRPDLSQGALLGEEDRALHQQMQSGSAEAKRLYDSKLRE